MKKLLTLLLAMIMVLSLAACGGNKATTKLDEKFVGDWVGVGGDVFDITMTAEEAAAYTMKVAENGKVALSIDGETLEATGTVSGDTLTFKEPALDITNTAVLTDNVLYLENIMDFGINVYMVKEGDTSYDPTQFMPEELQAVVGIWQSYEVLNVLDEDVSDQIPADALTMEFLADGTANIMIGEDFYPEERWVMMDTFGYLEESACDLTWDMEDGELRASYYDAEDNGFYFTCEKID